MDTAQLGDFVVDVGLERKDGSQQVPVMAECAWAGRGARTHSLVWRDARAADDDASEWRRRVYREPLVISRRWRSHVRTTDKGGGGQRRPVACLQREALLSSGLGSRPATAWSVACAAAGNSTSCGAAAGKGRRWDCTWLALYLNRLTSCLCRWNTYGLLATGWAGAAPNARVHSAPILPRGHRPRACSKLVVIHHHHRPYSHIRGPFLPAWHHGIKACTHSYSIAGLPELQARSPRGRRPPIRHQDSRTEGVATATATASCWAWANSQPHHRSLASPSSPTISSSSLHHGYSLTRRRSRPFIVLSIAASGFSAPRQISLAHDGPHRIAPGLSCGCSSSHRPSPRPREASNGFSCCTSAIARPFPEPRTRARPQRCRPHPRPSKRS